MYFTAVNNAYEAPLWKYFVRPGKSNKRRLRKSVEDAEIWPKIRQQNNEDLSADLAKTRGCSINNVVIKSLTESPFPPADFMEPWRLTGQSYGFKP